MSFRACMETNDMQLLTTMSHTVTSMETVLTVPKRKNGAASKVVLHRFSSENFPY